MMTSAKTIPGARLPDKRLPIDSPTNGETLLRSVIAIPRSEAVTAGQKRHTTSWDLAILPAKGTAPRRVMESTAAHVLTPRAIVGRTRQAQRARCRTGRAGRLRTSLAPRIPRSGTARCGEAQVGFLPRGTCGPARGELSTYPALARSVIRRAVSSATARTSDRRDSPPSLFGRPVRRTGVGCTYPPSLPSRGTQMPFMLRFHDTDDTTEMPDPAQVGHAAAWAAERGYWDVATCLMELAHALAEAETPTPARDPRYVDQAAPHPESRLTRALEHAKHVTELPHEPQPTCSHGYATDRAPRHIGTGGLCGDAPRWCGAPEELGGQQTCPLPAPCPIGACEIGERIPFDGLGPADRP